MIVMQFLCNSATTTYSSDLTNGFNAVFFQRAEYLVNKFADKMACCMLS